MVLTRRDEQKRKRRSKPANRISRRDAPSGENTASDDSENGESARRRVRLYDGLHRNPTTLEASHGSQWRYRSTAPDQNRSSPDFCWLGVREMFCGA